MQVREGMSPMVLSVGPGHTIRQVARLMHDRRVGSAVVMDPDGPGPGLITERDILEVIGSGGDPDRETVGDHQTRNIVFASPDWSLEHAAAEMVKGGFRHLLVTHDGDICGILSMRDIVRCWSTDGATSEMPAGAAT